MHIVKICLCVAATLTVSECFFNNPLKKLRQKAKNIYNSKFGKDKSWHFLGHDLSEYPGTNTQYRKLNRDKWEEYYTCLKAQEDNLGTHLSATPEAMQAFQGASVRFGCKVCLSPSERARSDLVEWYWGPADATKLEPVEYTEHTLLSPEDKTLHIYNVQPDHSGQYLCILGNSLVAPYFLTVLNNSENLMRNVYPVESGRPPPPRDEEDIQGYPLILDTEWGEWSPCSRCGHVGKRNKLGYCTIQLLPPNDKMVNVHNDLNKTTTQISEDDLELLRIFSFGLPCRSHILPQTLKALSQLKERKDELMTGFCKEDCPANEVFEVKDKNGNVVEVANNSAGIYSMLQGPPPAEPSIERILLYGIKGQHVEISCPGNLNSDVPVQWQIGSKNVVAELLVKQSNGRVYVSLADKIHIKKATIADSNIYSCWQQQELAGTVRLVVEKKIVWSFNHHMMLLGIFIILSVFLYVFVNAFFGRKYARV